MPPRPPSAAHAEAGRCAPRGCRRPRIRGSLAARFHPGRCRAARTVPRRRRTGRATRRPGPPIPAPSHHNRDRDARRNTPLRRVCPAAARPHRGRRPRRARGASRGGSVRRRGRARGPARDRRSAGARVRHHRRGGRAVVPGQPGRSTLLNSVLPAGVLGDLGRAVVQGRTCGDLRRAASCWSGSPGRSCCCSRARSRWPRDRLSFPAPPGWGCSPPPSVSSPRSRCGRGGGPRCTLPSSRCPPRPARATRRCSSSRSDGRRDRAAGHAGDCAAAHRRRLGPSREFTALAFGASGLGAGARIAASVFYGVLALVTTLPGLLTIRARTGAARTRDPTPRAPRAPSPPRPATGARPLPTPCTAPGPASGGG